MNTRSPAAQQTLAFAGTVGAMLVTFRVLDTVITRLGQRPVIAYDEVSRWWRLVSGRLPWWLLVAGAGLVALAAWIDARRFGGVGRRRLGALFAGWGELEDGRALRWLVVAITAVPAWA